jgi:hypothetical protein
MQPGTSLSPASRERRGRGRIVLAVIVVALVALIVPPLVQVNRLRGMVAGAMESALGRPVSVGSVSLRLLPRPGFDLHRLVIAEDPAFGAEPMLRADEVTATFRLASLWRGRLELARLTLKSGSDISAPSLNLVLAPDGRWNIEALLQRASRTPSAPTALTHAEARPRFPYIEASGGRINFKVGPEKKVYALVDGDFALWLASENEWMFRLAARPVRTDFNLSDTGVVRINGRFRRAADLRDTPLEITASLQQAQLGEFTKFLTGGDKGWRGVLDINLQATGTPARLQLAARANVSDLRSYYINTTEKLSLQASCSAGYSTVAAEFSDLDCRMPLGSGALLAHGGVYGSSSPRAYDVKLSAEDVPLQSLVAFARHAKKDIPADLSAEGTLNGSFTFRKIEHGPAFLLEGGATTTRAVLRSAVLSPEFSLSPLEVQLQGPWTESAPTRSKVGMRGRPAAARTPSPETPRVVLSPVQLALGGATPAEASGWFSGERYEVSVAGDTQIPRLFQLGRALGLRVPKFTVEGGARMELMVAGAWSGFAPPRVTGTAQLHSVSVPMRGLNTPFQVATANLVLAPEWARLQKLNARFAGSPVAFGGWLRMARGCEVLEQCPIDFDLQSDELTADELNRLLNPTYAKRPWYQVFGGGAASTLGHLQARGRLSVGRFSVRSLTATRVTANVELQGGKLRLSEHADLLGGKQEGDWQADFNGSQPAYEGRGTMTGMAMAQLAGLMHDNWAAGSVNGEYTLKLAGWSASELAASANGSATFNWQKGILRHITLSSGPLQFQSFTGKLSLRNATLTLAVGNMGTPAGLYQVSGTASLGRDLGMTFRGADRAFTVSGPLDKPKVAEADDEQATLRP